MIGSLVSHYEILEHLGQGGMGVVYEAEQDLKGVSRRVAVKTLHRHLSQDASIGRRFLRECATIARLEHPHTIRLFDFGVSQSQMLP